MDDRWQFFEYLKNSKGYFAYESFKGMRKMELFEGLAEFEIWCDREEKNEELEMMNKCKCLLKQR